MSDSSDDEDMNFIRLNRLGGFYDHLQDEHRTQARERLVTHTDIPMIFFDEQAVQYAQHHDIDGVNNFNTASRYVQMHVFVFALANILNFSADDIGDLRYLYLRVDMAIVANILGLCFSVRALRQHVEDYADSFNNNAYIYNLIPGGDSAGAPLWKLSSVITQWLFRYNLLGEPTIPHIWRPHNP